jgi:electron transport complex protein RnfB
MSGVIAALIAAGLLAGAILPARQRPVSAVTTRAAQRIDALLPQTQCGACGYAGCRPYADAVAHGRAAIDRCPPGGDRTLRALAELVGIDPPPPPFPARPAARVAWIDESTCIGCVKCIRACPVDAIIGAPKQLHAVVARWCTGCALCVPACPVDCIELVPEPAVAST